MNNDLINRALKALLPGGEAVAPAPDGRTSDPRQAPGTGSQTAARPAASYPPANSQVKPAAAAPADKTADKTDPTDPPPAASAAVPVVRGGRKSVPYGKGAGERVPPGTSTGPIVAEDQTQQNQATGIVGKSPAAEKVSAASSTAASAAPPEPSLLPAEVTIERVLEEFGRLQRVTTQRVLLIGLLSEAWIRDQLVRGTALDRATAIKKIREQLAALHLEKKEARVDLYLRCYHAAVLFGGWRPDSQRSREAANSLAFSALRLFPILIERDKKTDMWSIDPAYEAAGRALWARAVKERLPASVVNEELAGIVPRTVALKRLPPAKLAAAVKLIERLPVKDLPALAAKLQSMMASRHKAAA